MKVKIFNHIDKNKIYGIISKWIIENNIDYILTISFCEERNDKMSAIINYKGCD